MSTLRKLRRYVAKVKMKREGMTRFCKHHVGTNNTKVGSYFSRHWREYA